MGQINSSLGCTDKGLRTNGRNHLIMGVIMEIADIGKVLAAEGAFYAVVQCAL